MLGRWLGAPAWGSVAVAVGFLCCGVFTAQAQHLSRLCSFAFLPGVLRRWDLALLSRRVRPAVEAGLLWGLSALSGYPGLTVLTGGYLVLWAVGRWLFPRRDAGSPSVPGSGPPFLAVVARGLVLVVVAGAAVLAPTYLVISLVV